MRMSPGGLANGAAWAVLLGLAAMAIVLVVILGPFGLVLLGLLTVFVCSQFTLDEHAPTWGRHVFGAAMDDAVPPEQRAAQAAARQVALSPVHYYRWCGVVLLLAGVAGVAWQYG
jgi:hypothetical protein